jgi:hypothetical protein
MTLTDAKLRRLVGRKALDRIRRDRALAARLPALAEPAAAPAFLDEDVSSLPDDRLRMLFACCHPALAPEARLALTLRSVAGTPTPASPATSRCTPSGPSSCGAPAMPPRRTARTSARSPSRATSASARRCDAGRRDDSRRR